MFMIALASREKVKLNESLHESWRLSSNKLTNRGDQFDAPSFGQRLRTAFKGAKNAQIAKELGVSESAVSNYVAGRVPDAITLIKIKDITNCDLHWLLTGENPQIVESLTEEQADEGFDIEAAIRVNDNPRLVMRQWYEFEDKDVPTDFVGSLSLEDWDKRPIDVKVRQIRAMRDIYERGKKRQQMYASTKSENS